METFGDTALRVDPARRVAAHLEGEDARDVGLEGDRLQVEHQLDMLVERVGHASRSAWQLARVTAHVARFDLLNSPLDLADVVKVPGHALAIARVERFIQLGDLTGHVIEDAAGGAAARGTFLRRSAGAEQLIE